MYRNRSAAYLDLLYESRSQLLHANLDSGALAVFVVLLAGVGLSAHNLTQVRDIQHLAEVKLAQRDTQGNLHIGSACLFLLSSVAAKAKVFENAEWILSRRILPDNC